MTDTQIESQKPTQSRSERGRHQVGSPHPILNFPNPFSRQSQGLSSNGKSGHVPAIWLPGMKSSAGQRVDGAGVTPACRLHLLPPHPAFATRHHTRLGLRAPSTWEVPHPTFHSDASSRTRLMWNSFRKASLTFRVTAGAWPHARGAPSSCLALTAFCSDLDSATVATVRLSPQFPRGGAVQLTAAPPGPGTVAETQRTVMKSSYLFGGRQAAPTPRRGGFLKHGISCQIPVRL